MGITDLKVTLLLINVSVSSNTSEPDIGARKSSGFRHLSNNASQIWERLRTGSAPGGLKGNV